ncbi:MAG: single-stranded DNA-binding protein [Rhodanobacter sp.]|nr:MAG: single-stranded DNA-binding protein [Rhodanobacter sp.]
MGMSARLTGNVLATPTLKHVQTAKGDQPLVQFRVMSAYYRKTDDGKFEQNDDKTFPVDVTVWNERLHDGILKHIKTGASVTITGDVYVNPWVTDAGTAEAGVQISAEQVSLNLARVEQVVYRERRRNEERAGDAEASDIPF